jgi:hypothetical protein
MTQYKGKYKKLLHNLTSNYLIQFQTNYQDVSCVIFNNLLAHARHIYTVVICEQSVQCCLRGRRTFLAYFPKVGLYYPHAVCVSVNHPY